MKKFLVITSLLVSTLGLAVYATDTPLPQPNNIKTYCDNEKWGLKDDSGNIIVKAQYQKLIRLEDSSWIVQNKKNKYGLIDNNGNVLVPIKYNHADRIVSKFAKFGNNNDFGIYNSKGETIIEPKYKKIDILYGQMFLTYKNFKYGIVGYDGKTILDNEFDDIYMPKPNIMRLRKEGQWIELEQINAETLTLPKNIKNTLNQEDLKLKDIVVTTGVISGYSVLTISDYAIKILSSISPAHEDTIDELLLSQGADTVNIFMKMTWLPKYPIVYGRKYIENIRNPFNGPLAEIRSGLIKHIK